MTVSSYISLYLKSVFSDDKIKARQTSDVLKTLSNRSNYSVLSEIMAERVGFAPGYALSRLPSPLHPPRAALLGVRILNNYHEIKITHICWLHVIFIWRRGLFIKLADMHFCTYNRYSKENA